MYKSIVVVTAAALLLPALATAATKPKLGLWENTVTMNFDKPPFEIPAEQAAKMKQMGIKLPGMGPQTHTTQHCLTQADLDKFDNGNLGDNSGCAMQNHSKTSNGYSADVVCTGHGQNTKGHIDVVYDDAEHYHGNSHMSGTLTGGPGGAQSKPIEMTMQMSGKWISAQCPAGGATP